jgi:hypothetical protein
MGNFTVFKVHLANDLSILNGFISLNDLTIKTDYSLAGLQ